MLAQLASLASLARVRPLITHQAYQLAGAWGSHPLWTLVGRKERQRSFYQWEGWKDGVSQPLLLSGNLKTIKVIYEMAKHQNIIN